MSDAFNVFLSHNSQDRPAVRELATALRKRELRVWLDEDKLRPGIPWQKSLEDGIRASASIAVLIGKDGLGPWENEEMQAALRLAIKEQRPVIPVILPDAPQPPELPMYLNDRTWVDLRPALSEAGLEKLEWGITGVKPNQSHEVVGDGLHLSKNAQMLVKNFGYVANAPNGIKQLRELILQQAVTGALTEREQNDTPAEALFRHNQKHRDRLIAEKAFRKQKPLPPINDASVPGILPDTWKWCRLGQVTSYGSTQKAEYSDVVPETWVLELEDIEKETSRLLSKVRAKNRRFRSSKNRFAKGQVLYGKLRPYLDKVLVADEEGVCTTEIIPILPFKGIFSEYLRWYLKSPLFKSYANDSTHGMNLPRLGTEPARSALFAFPPIEEQKRIVSKVDELMALCDKLEAQQQERERRLPVLSRAAHARFVESPTRANFTGIFDVTVLPDDLRKTILSHAVRGGFVPFETTNDRQIVGDHFDFLNGYAFRSEWFEPSGTRLCRNTNVSHGFLNWSEPAHISKEVADEFSRFALFEGDIVLSLDRPLISTGLKVARIRKRDLPCLLLQRVAKPVPKHNEIDLDFFYLWLNSSDFIDSIDPGRSNGVPHISTRQIQKIPFSLPPIHEQHRIVAKVDQLMALVNKLENQQARKANVAHAFAEAALTAITGTEVKEQKEKMKAPKTELVSRLQTKSKPKATDQAPLTNLLAKHKGELAAKTLWQQSGLEIDAFYQQLKTEMSQGWIIEPEKARMTEVEAD